MPSELNSVNDGFVHKHEIKKDPVLLKAWPIFRPVLNQIRETEFWIN